MYFFVISIIYFSIRLWWCNKILFTHIDYVYACVKRWHIWTYGKDENGNYKDDWRTRNALCEAYTMKSKQYESLDDLYIMMIKFWILNPKKFIKDVEVYKSIGWDNPQDKNIIAKGLL